MQEHQTPITKRGDAPEADKLRELASWYREYAGSTVIWEARLRIAEDLETEANPLEQTD